MKTSLLFILLCAVSVSRAERRTCGYIDSLETGRTGVRATRKARLITPPGNMDVIFTSFGKSGYNQEIFHAFRKQNKPALARINLNTAFGITWCNKSYYIPVDFGKVDWSLIRTLKPGQHIRIHLAYLTGNINRTSQRIVFIDKVDAL